MKSTGLRSRVVTDIDAIDARAWDSVVTSAGMRHAAAKAMHGARVNRDWVYGLVRDAQGPYAAITGRPHDGSPLLRRALLEVTSHLGLLGGIQIRKGVALEDALPRLLPTLGRMARRLGCAAFSVFVTEPEAAIFAKRGFAFFSAPNTVTSDVSRFTNYEQLLASLPERGGIGRACRRAKAHGIRFEMTSPPRAPEHELFELVKETFAAHGTPLPFTSELFGRIWKADFAEHLLFSGYLEERLVVAMWCFHADGVLTVAVPGIHYEVARPSMAFLALLDEILRFAMAHRIHTIEWGPTIEDIKRRYGGTPRRLLAAVRPALPFPEPVWKATRRWLRTDLGARIFGERELGPPSATASSGDAEKARHGRLP